MIGYLTRKKVRVVAGAPVCALEHLAGALAEWEAACSRARVGVCYFGAEARIRTLLADMPGYSVVSLGAQPNWDPQCWASIFDGDKSLRAQRSRAANKGIRVTEWADTSHSSDLGLRYCLQAWLLTRGLPPMHFLVEPQTLDHKEDRRVFVAEKAGAVVGFLVLSPIPQRQGWLTEQFPRGVHAPNGTVEILMDTAIRAVAASGAEYVTMGIVPLSLHALPNLGSNPNWLEILAKWVRAHGRRFYNFDGLDRFKSKFHPQEWEPIVVISKEPQFSVKTLLAIAAAFSDGSPTWAMSRAILKAARQELRWAIRSTNGGQQN